MEHSHPTESRSPWLLRGILATLALLGGGIADAAGADTWEAVKTLVQAFTG